MPATDNLDLLLAHVDDIVQLDPVNTSHTMSSPFIKRAKARTNLRQRDDAAPGSPLARTTDDAGDEDEETSVSPMQMAKNRKKDKEKRKTGSTGKTRLSFGGEDEEVRDSKWALGMRTSD